MAKDSLKTYRDRRDFKRSPEPPGADRRQSGEHPIFVIQKHDASRLHYDFRLEVDGVLVSWAVPKGPSMDTRQKRLAIQTEDHPLDYADFEGVIPQQEYGGGTVMVWDAGTYRNCSADRNDKPLSMQKAFAAGKIVIALSGKKLRGRWALVRMRKQEQQWLLIKEKDDFADARRNPVSTHTKSVLSQRTLHQITKEAKRDG